MLQIEIVTLKPEYKKYLFDDRFICKGILVKKDSIRFRSLWGENGWDRELTTSNGYCDIKITEVC